jgi:branched-chain amino acid transport system permease protein
VGLFLQLLVSGFITGSVYALLGVSWGIIYNTSRTFHFAHGLVYTLAAYIIVLFVELSLPLIPSILIGLMGATVLGCAIEYFAYQPMREKKASQLAIFLTSLGIMIAGQSLIQLLFGPDPRPLKSFQLIPISIGPVTFTNINLFTVILIWIILVLVFIFLARTRSGMMIRAVSSNPEKATFIGIDSKKIFVLVFGIGSLLVGIASFLSVLDNPANPNIGVHALLMSFITVFLGGVGNLSGTVVAGVMLGIAESVMLIVLPTEYKVVMTFSILFLVILIKPEGLMGKKSA